MIRMALAILLAGCAFSVRAYELRPISDWSQTGFEIYSPAIDNQGRISFVRKWHWPDGHEGEYYPESYFKALRARKEKEPRFADPEIVVMDLASKKIDFIDWGWDPAFSPDGEKLVYARQAKPITGRRVLARTMAGNSIGCYVFSNRSKSDLVAPNQGYLSSPQFTSNETVLFSYSDAINGAWGGTVGVGRYDTLQHSRADLLAPAKSHGLFHLVAVPQAADGKVYVLRRTPQDAQMMYLARNYHDELLEIGNGVQLVHDFGIRGFNEEPYNVFVVNGRIIVLYADGWKELGKTTSKKLSKKTTMPYPNPQATAFALLDAGTLSIFDVDGAVLAEASVSGIPRQVVWSPDARRLAVVTSQMDSKNEDKFVSDQLAVFELN